MQPENSVPVYVDIYDGTGKRISFEAHSIDVANRYNQRSDPDDRLTVTRDWSHVEVEIDTGAKLEKF